MEVWSGNFGWHQLTGSAVIGLIIVFCSLAGALLIARSIGRPVRVLNLVAEEFAKGNCSARAPTEGPEEIARSPRPRASPCSLELASGRLIKVTKTLRTIAKNIDFPGRAGQA